MEYNWYNFPGDISKVSKLEGVYLLSEQASENGIVYIGRADNLQDRLFQHPDPENLCLQRKNISYFAYEITSDSENREKELINWYGPSCNNRT